MRPETLARALRRYDRAPHLVFWETTKACSLACRHCRASAQTQALPGELSTQEGFEFIEQLADIDGATPILILTGGDCFARPDLDTIVAYARERGIRVGVSPSVTEQLTRERLVRLYEMGVRSISLSLDGSGAQSHDGIRGIVGHFDQTVEAILMTRDLGFRVQVNTTVMERNATELADVATLLVSLGVPIWEVFFLVGVGRGIDVREISPQDAEDICHFLVDVTQWGLTVRTVEAPFFRRVQAEREATGDGDPSEHFDLGPLYSTLRARLGDRPPAVLRATPSHSLATGDGRGVVFVGYDGAVHASGFLPIELGNVRETSIGEIYATNELLTALRSGELSGACAECRFRQLCGGSRARAYARSGSVLGEDPLCVNSEWAQRRRLRIR